MKQTVLIAGAGPVGMTLASELARYGIQARIVDKSVSRTDKSKAVTLWSRTLVVEREVELASFAAGSDGVDAILRHADGRSEAVAAGWLVGCDGAVASGKPDPAAMRSLMLRYGFVLSGGDEGQPSNTGAVR